jgi:hypothetical protein
MSTIKRFGRTGMLVAVVALVGWGAVPAPTVAETQTTDACWGQATQVFARMGVMGEHASSYDNPRLGLRNLARALYELGVLPDDSMASLGAFVAGALELSIEACQ